MTCKVNEVRRTLIFKTIVLIKDTHPIVSAVKDKSCSVLAVNFLLHYCSELLYVLISCKWQ